MNDQKAKEIIDVIIGQLFGFQNPYTLEQFAAKFAFDIRQTVEVFDYQTGESTWAQNSKNNKYVKFSGLTGSDSESMIPKEPVNSIDDIVRIWQKTNITAAERYLNSTDVIKSDAIYGCQNIYKCIDLHDSKNVLFSESSHNCEYSAAIQRSNNCVYSLRVDDSKQVSKSFQVSWSGNISNCFFIKDCTDMSDCMFCSQVNGKRFCIANMQFEEAEYRKWEAVVKQWILSN
jgi:hypothetical protein